jgi:hypothetical protein
MRLQPALPQFLPGLLARHLLQRLLQLLQLLEAVLARHLGLEPEVPLLSMGSVVAVRIRGQLSVLLVLLALSRVISIRNACENLGLLSRHGAVYEESKSLRLHFCTYF